MRRTTRVLPGKHAGYLVLGMILLATLAVPVQGADTPGCTKSYNIVLQLAPTGVTEQALQRVYGYNPLPKEKRGDLMACVTADNGRVLQEWYLHDPRNQVGDDISIDKNGTKSRVKGIHSQESTAVLAVMFRQEPGAASFTLYDNKGTLLKTVDLRKAEDRTTWDCTPDYGIVHKSRSGIPVPYILGGIAILLVTAAGAGWYFLRKEKGGNGQ